MMKTNLRNQIRQTPLPKWKPMLPVFEATMNAFQAINEAKRHPGTGNKTIFVERERNLIDEDHAAITNFTIVDNGIGFNDDNFNSFNTVYTDHKEGGKGLGRIMWLKAFERVEIDSIFVKDGCNYARCFIFDNEYDNDTERGEAKPIDSTEIGTKVRLVGFKDPYCTQFPRMADQFVQRLVEHFLLIFLEPTCPAVYVQDGRKHSANDVFEENFKTTATRAQFTIKRVPFTFYGFRLTTPRVAKHKLVYAANQRGVVADNLEDYIANLSGRLPNPDGTNFVYLGVVQSVFLNEHVNPSRTDFDIGLAPDADDILPEAEADSLLVDEIARADIRAECLGHIQHDLANVIKGINEAKADKVRMYVDQDAPQYKVLMKHLPEFIDRIPANPSRTQIDALLHQEIHEREIKLKQESSRILREADKKGGYFEQIEEQLTEFIENYNELGVAALARYVGQRRLLLDHLERAISKCGDTERYPLEKVVHQLIFPRYKTSDDVKSNEQNLWMIDERLTYQTFISSDKPLSSLKSQVGTPSRRRPDLVLFDRKIVFGDNDHPVKSLILIEFKKPMRNDYTMEKNPLLQCFEMIEDIRSGRFKDPKTGRPISVAGGAIPAYCYIICDITETLQRVLKAFQAFSTPDNQGFYGFHKDYAAYYEVTDYNKLLRDAKQRNRIFFDKLNILGNQ